MFNYIKAHRKCLGLTQTELGYLIGFDNNVRISKIEAGQAKPNLKEIVIFELLFDKAASRLFRDLYRNIADNFLHRIALFDDYLCEDLSSREKAHKLEAMRKVRRAIAKENQSRI